MEKQLQYVFGFRATAIDNIFEPAGNPDGAAPGSIAVAGGTATVDFCVPPTTSMPLPVTLCSWPRIGV